MALKSKPKPQKDRSERWLLTYADLITLLMVFFVILYSFSIIDVRKFFNFKGSLTQAFTSGVLSGIQTSGINETVSGSSVQEQITASSNVTSQVSVASELQKIADATGLGESVVVSRVPEGVTVSLAANVLFQSGNEKLKPGAEELLSQIAVPLVAIPEPLEISANTDELAPASTNSAFKDNWDLGNARAYSVMRVLLDKNKFQPQRLSLGNHAEYNPLYPPTSPENRAKNRRVDILIVFPRPEDQPIGLPFQVPGPAIAQGGGPRR